VNEAIFLRQFLALARAEHFDYNFCEAFDQIWKYQSEGVVGANWGIYDANRHLKIPVTGPISNDPDWWLHAAISIAAGLALSLLGLWQGRRLSPARQNLICAAGMALGAALGFAATGATAGLYDAHVELAAAVNMAGQTALALLAMARLSGAVPAAPGRAGRDATEAVRQLLLRARLPKLHGAFEDLAFLFVWTAAVLQMLLWCDSRYRDFPLCTFAVPVLVTVGRLLAGDVPRCGGGREEFFAGLALIVAAAGSAIQEGPLNGQSLLWNACALFLAVPVLVRLRKVRK
jgi:hypothetical protein